MIQQYNSNSDALVKTEFNKLDEGFNSYLTDENRSLLAEQGLGLDSVNMVGENVGDSILSFYYKDLKNTEDNYFFSSLKCDKDTGTVYTKKYFKGTPPDAGFGLLLDGSEIVAYGVIADTGITTVFTPKDDSGINEHNFTSDGMTYRGYTFDSDYNLLKDAYYVCSQPS